jgi:hypothetical protein
MVPRNLGRFGLVIFVFSVASLTLNAHADTIRTADLDIGPDFTGAIDFFMGTMQSAYSGPPALRSATGSNTGSNTGSHNGPVNQPFIAGTPRDASGLSRVLLVLPENMTTGRKQNIDDTFDSPDSFLDLQGTDVSHGNVGDESATNAPIVLLLEGSLITTGGPNPPGGDANHFSPNNRNSDQWNQQAESLVQVGDNTPLALPEPATLSLLGSGLGLLIIRRLRR